MNKNNPAEADESSRWAILDPGYPHHPHPHKVKLASLKGALLFFNVEDGYELSFYALKHLLEENGVYGEFAKDEKNKNMYPRDIKFKYKNIILEDPRGAPGTEAAAAAERKRIGPIKNDITINVIYVGPWEIDSTPEFGFVGDPTSPKMDGGRVKRTKRRASRTKSNLSRSKLSKSKISKKKRSKKSKNKRKKTRRRRR